MNKANLKSYAPKARLDFIKAVTARANVLGISAAGMVPAEVRGDVALIDGREWPAKVAGQRDELIARIKRHGFEQTMDEVAYTWFNRFASLRYMEIHDYLGHGWRVLSSRDGGLPEILRHASEVTLPGLNPDRARTMQLAGNQDNELYKLLLVAQCNDLSRVMPFLFERIDDETELLLPENLLRTDSIVAKLVESVPEEDWQEIEVIGWLYQFYISDKKDQVIGKVVKSEDIPAATQLFTPNWIVQYLVQNSVGRLWLMANPSSTLASQWPYYIQPAEQTPEVQAQLDALIQTRISEDGETLNPETITVLDPACGSGHILVVAYEVLKAIYLERGYQLRSIPRLILERNLFGLDIDDRAAQLAAFALLMKARADDRRLFDEPPHLNVLSLQASQGLELDEIARSLATFGLQRAFLKELLDTFAHAKTYGSLIKISLALNVQLRGMTGAMQRALREGDLYARQTARETLPLLLQALLLGSKFDAVVANPPYMGSKGMNQALKEFAKVNFPDSKGDTFAIFVERAFGWCKTTGFHSMVTMQSWMFLASFEDLRRNLVSSHTLSCMAHMDNGVMGIAFGTAATIFQNAHSKSYEGSFSYCENSDIADDGYPRLFPVQNGRLRTVAPDDFRKIPGEPIAYWLSKRVFDVFADSKRFGSIGDARMGLATGNNDRYVRLWYEVDLKKFGLNIKSRDDAKASGKRWFPYSKGGSFRKWYGNNEHVVDWYQDGVQLQTGRHESGRIWAHNFNLDYIFRDSITWSDITSGPISVRSNANGFLFDGSGTCAFFCSTKDKLTTLGFLNSKFADLLSKVLNPTFHFQTGDFRNLPYRQELELEEFLINVKSAVQLAKEDWDSVETSWDFGRFPWVNSLSAKYAWNDWSRICAARIDDLKNIEEKNNTLILEIYGVHEELTPEVPEEQITLGRADRAKDCQRLISYAIGCIMGRYSLDEPGIIYAHSGNIDFETGRYEKTFQADADGIAPITDERWFEDDTSSRVREFMRSVWGGDTLDENMAWVAESLSTKGSETPDETVRRYLADKFYKDHLQTYKKRPIYWLFSSGKHSAFQALVYLHRYNEGTLARMRAEYVVPLIAKMVSRLDMLAQDVAAATSPAARTKLQKQIEALRKKQIELLAYDEKLRHYADMRITLDLDDGVKVNYAKFGDLVAEAKAVTGGSDD